MGEDKSDVLQGTLDLMVLKTLESMIPRTVSFLSCRYLDFLGSFSC